MQTPDDPVHCVILPVNSHPAIPIDVVEKSSFITFSDLPMLTIHTPKEFAFTVLKKLLKSFDVW